MNKSTLWRVILYSGIVGSLYATTWTFWDILNYGEFCAIEPNKFILVLEFTFFTSLFLIFFVYMFFNLKKEIDKELEEENNA